MSDSTPPSDSASWNRRVDSANRRAVAASPSATETIPPKADICACREIVTRVLGEPGVVHARDAHRGPARKSGDRRGVLAVPLHPEAERLDAARGQPGVQRTRHRAHRELEESHLLERARRRRGRARRRRRRSARRGTSSSECTTTSAPSASGCWRAGEANVLSTTTSAPASWPRRARPGDVGDPQQRIARRLDPHDPRGRSSSAAATASRSLMSTMRTPDAPRAEDPRDEPVGAAVDVAAEQHLVAGLRARRAAGRLRRRARRRTRARACRLRSRRAASRARCAWGCRCGRTRTPRADRRCRPAHMSSRSARAG